MVVSEGLKKGYKVGFILFEIHFLHTRYRRLIMREFVR